MKQNIFTTRQRAAELTKEAVSIWEQSNSSESLEGIEQDPVLSLFMTALAYQANEIDNEIEQFKTDIINEFSQMLIPYDRTNAVPATAVVEVSPNENVPMLTLDHKTHFNLSDSDFEFIPLLNTKVYNCSVTSVVRLDERRWKVKLDSKEPINNLSGLTFTIGNSNFQDLKVFMQGFPLPVIKPWDYADLPLNKCFSIDNMIYSQSSSFQLCNTWFDLFAKQNMRIFTVDTYKTPSTTSFAENKLELIFEFTGINDKFIFNKEEIFLNCTILVNATVQSATLSSNTPLICLSGSQNGTTNSQFMHLVRPSDTQVFKDEPIEIRKIGADRFNPSHLIKLTSTLITRFSSDYYAFQNIDNLKNGNQMGELYAILKNISNGLNSAKGLYPSGIYLMLKNNNGLRPKDLSLDINYLTTNGSEVNGLLNSKCNFKVASMSYIKSANLLGTPTPGHDELQSVDAEMSLARYYMITNDRLVTPADIKIFCYNELISHYSITSNMISDIKVRNVRNTERNHCGFETMVYIFLNDDPFVKRHFLDQIPTVEIMLQKMIEIRSTNILPVHVNIEII